MPKRRKGGRKASRVMVSMPRRPGKTTLHNKLLGIDKAKPGSEKTVVASMADMMGNKPCLVLHTKKGTAYFAQGEPPHVIAFKYGLIR